MALAIEIELLAGRYAATRFNDRTQAEWPPHLARLFSAAVALWADGEPRSAEEENVLRWLERQPAPEIACSDEAHIAVREGTTHFVPVNDASAAPSADATYAALRAGVDAAAELAGRAPEAPPSSRDRQRVDKQIEKARQGSARHSRKANERTLAPGAIEVFPDERGRQARTFPSIRPDDPRVVYRWPDATPDAAQRATLDGLLARIGRLGHSTSLVSCRVSDEIPSPSLVPDEHGSAVVRVPGDGQLDLLEEEFARHRGNEPRALPAVMQPYAPVVALPDSVPGSVFSSRFAVLEVDASTPVSLRASLHLTRALRAALLEHAGDDAPELLSGLRVDAGTREARPSDRAHGAIVPLPFVGHRHADGAVLGVAFVTPDGRDDERDAALKIIWAWLGETGGRLRIRGRDVIVQRPDGLASLATIRPRRWCAPSDTWATVTPIALDRWPGDLRDRDAERRAVSFARAEELVARAGTHVGLPRPESVVVRPDAFVSGVPPAHRFPAFQTPNGGPHRPLVHACVTFGAAVAGPVLLGAGRYVGQGLCLPLDPTDPRHEDGTDDG